MSFFIPAIFVLLSAVISISLCKKYDVLLNYNGNKHQKYTSSKKIPMAGGVVSLLFVFVFIDFNLSINIFLFSIFVVGILSDLKLLESPTKRLFVQFLIIIIFLYTLDIHLVSTRFKLLDFLLENNLFSFLFSTFCILIVINGTNFIDGNNTNVLGYYLIISFIFLFLKDQQFNTIDTNSNLLVIELISILLIFNFFNKIYLGDSGAFLLGAAFGFMSIKLYLDNSEGISSFFIVLLLWYPAFENLFSIIRKFYFSKSPMHPDNNHLHQLLYFFLTKKLSWNQVLLNSSVGLLINFYNFIILFIGATKLYHTQFMIFLILVNLFVYILLYLGLFQFKNSYLKK